MQPHLPPLPHHLALHLVHPTSAPFSTALPLVRLRVAAPSLQRPLSAAASRALSLAAADHQPHPPLLLLTSPLPPTMVSVYLHADEASDAPLPEAESTQRHAGVMVRCACDECWGVRLMAVLCGGVSCGGGGCCAVLCCAVLCCAVLCCAVLCCGCCACGDGSRRRPTTSATS